MGAIEDRCASEMTYIVSGGALNSTHSLGGLPREVTSFLTQLYYFTKICLGDAKIADLSKTGNRYMAETCAIDFSYPSSYPNVIV